MVCASLEGGIRKAAYRRALAARWDRKPSCILGSMVLEYVFRKFKELAQLVKWVIMK